ncbi:MAG: isocitrate/isopropylmalate dehydrogenase family protein [Candidatus Micrarchaeota archaeon]|nr:isocitrate/isopropylmalate dehydrogenase family protein [Candidatus Micrarchaeota archaeon]
MKKILYIEGDGVGPELMAHARRAVDSIAKVEWVRGEAGFATFQKTGTTLPDATVQAAKESDAILFCAVTTPPNILNYKSAIVALRKELDLYANLRPFCTLPNVPVPFPALNFAIVRENTEGMYSGIEKREGDSAFATRVITKKGSERIARFAFEYAKRQGFSKVTIVHKANVLRLTDGLFLEAARGVAAGYPEIACEDALVDSVAMRLVKSPQEFQVIVTTNLFGDILSDESSALVGGLGVAPSGNYGGKHALFEPVHGSAPKYAGKNVANPTGMLLSAAMMLAHIGEKEASEKLTRAVQECYSQKIITRDVGGSASTSGMVEKAVSLLG